MVKYVSFRGPGDAYLAVYRRDTSPTTAEMQICFLVRKSEIIAMSDRDFQLLQLEGQIKEGQLCEASPTK